MCREMDSHPNPADEFTAQDQAFFAEGEHLDEESSESFDDLDEGYRRPSFWDRLRRR